MRILRLILKYIGGINMFCFYIGAVAISALFALMFLDVAFRTLFSMPITGTVEISEYLLIGVAFLPLGYAQMTETHTRVTTFIRFLPVKMQRVLDVAACAVSMIFFGVMTIQVAKRAYADWAQDVLLSNTIIILPVWWKSGIAAFGLLCVALALFVQILSVIFIGPRELREGA